MTFRTISRIGLAVGLSFGVAQSGLAGVESVTPNQPVFIPPIIMTPTAPTTGSGGQTEEGDTETAGAEQQEAETEAAIAAEEEQVRTASRAFSEAQLICARLPQEEYTIDCLADQLEQYAADLPATPEFSQARSIVQDTAQRLNRVARSNASTTQRRATLRATTGDTVQESSRLIVPVATERLEAAQQEADAILEEAATQLLRASEQSERRRVAFSDVAQAVGSSRTLLLRAQ